MKISFIIPVYNVEMYLRQCIESILKQSEKEIEIILVDDGSSDNSGKICDEYAEKYINIITVHQKNMGVASARNKGMEICQGDWIFFMDSDDTIADDLVNRCKQFLNDDFDICFVGHSEVISEEKRKPTVTSDKVYILEKNDFNEFKLALFNRDFKGKYDYHALKMSTPCKFYKYSIIKKNNILFPVGIITGEDAIFNLQFYAVAEKGAYVLENLYYHRVWGGSVSKRYDENAMKHFELMHEILKEYLEKRGEFEALESAYNERCMWSIGFCCLLDFCNKENKHTYKERKNSFLTMRNKYEEQIKDVNLNNFRIEKKILFYFIKQKWFFLISILCFLKS